MYPVSRTIYQQLDYSIFGITILYFTLFYVIPFKQLQGGGGQKLLLSFEKENNFQNICINRKTDIFVAYLVLAKSKSWAL